MKRKDTRTGRDFSKFASHQRIAFRRRVLFAATRKTNPPGIGVRRPALGETPLSADEIFHGGLHGLIALPPFYPSRREQRA